MNLLFNPPGITTTTPSPCPGVDLLLKFPWNICPPPHLCPRQGHSIAPPMPPTPPLPGSAASPSSMARIRYLRAAVSGFYLWEAAVLLRWVAFFGELEVSPFPGVGQLKCPGRVRTAAAVTAFPHRERPATLGSQAVGTETKCLSSTLPERLPNIALSRIPFCILQAGCCVLPSLARR